MQILSVVNQKGGNGKTTTALALAEGLRWHGKNVLVVDLDAQANLTYAVGAPSATVTAYDAMKAGTIEGYTVQLGVGLDLLPGGGNLSKADTELSSVTGREYLLREALENAPYDYVIIDTPPSLGTLIVNALTASNGAIVTAQADIYSLQGIAGLNMTIQTVRKYCNPNLELLGVLLVRYNGRATLTRTMREELGRAAISMGTELYPVAIRECIAVKESQLVKKSLYEYAPKCNATQDYTQFVEEILRQTTIEE